MDAAGCAQPRDGDDGTWITSAMVDAYAALHRLGHAHSLEVWADEELAGGIYGLAIGGVFFGESMFSRRTDASKIALVALCRLIAAHGYGLLDCQVENDHLLSMGAERMTRDVFEAELARLVDVPADFAPWRASPHRSPSSFFSPRPRARAPASWKSTCGKFARTPVASIRINVVPLGGAD